MNAPPNRNPSEEPESVIRIVLGVVATFLACSFCGMAAANPVPDDVVEGFRELVLATARQDACPDTGALVQDFSLFGLELLPPEHVGAIAANFGVFAPMLVSAQRPNRMPRYEIQDLYRRHARGRQRDAMVAVLRSWLTAKVTEAPAEGDLRVLGPGPSATCAINRARVIAAEMLADWGDQGSSPLMESLAARESLDEDLRWKLHRARASLVDPCAMTLFRIRPDSSIEFCSEITSVRRVAIQKGESDSAIVLYTLTAPEITDLWYLLRGSRLSKAGWGGIGYPLVMELNNGMVARLCPTERGYVVYSDNTSLDYRRRLGLRSEALSEWIWKVSWREIQVELIRQGYSHPTE